MILRSSYAQFTLAIAGWTVTYVITVRGGGPSSGYISSGFYGGKGLKFSAKLL